MKQCLSFVIVVFFSINGIFAQSGCQAYLAMKDSLNLLIHQNHEARSPAAKKRTYDLFMSTSLRAADLVKKCNMEQGNAPGSKGDLMNNYLQGKYLYNAGKCNEAVNLFQSCLANPNCSVTRLGNAGTYSEVISRAFLKCYKDAPVDATAASAYTIEYNGKGGGFIKKLFEEVKDSVIFSNVPMSADEQEMIMGRIVRKTDIIDSVLVKSLSGNTEFILIPPFLFMKDKNAFIKKSITPEKNIDVGMQTTAKAPDMNDFSTFISKRYEELTAQYFNKFKPGDNLISFYLIGGEYTSEGLIDYLTFSNKIHFRAQKQVAYYMPLDNSIVSWASSGGGTLVHELIHALIYVDFPAAPLWLNEGLASLYEETDNNSRPLDNYRILYIQQAFKTNNCFIPLKDLFEVDKYQFLDEHNYNLINAYSRYFCKFLLDSFGEKKFQDIYKKIRDKKLATSTQQLNAISQITGLKDSLLQKEWENYLLKIKVPLKWLPYLNEIAKDDKKIIPVFPCSEILPAKNAIDVFIENRNKDMETIR